MALVKRLVKGSPLTAEEHDANLEYLEGLQNLIQNTPWYLDTGLTYKAIGYLMPIAGVGYTAPLTSITFDAADATYSRFDAIIGTNLGTIIKRTGVASAQKPLPVIDYETECLIATIEIEAGATTGTGLIVGVIYKENAEWTATENTSAVRINLASTNDTYEGTVSIEATSPVNGDTIEFTAPSPVNISELSLNRWRFKNKAAMPSGSYLQIQFFNGTTAVSSLINILDGTYGFTNSDTVNFQDIVNAYSDFNFTSSIVTSFKIRQNGSCLGWFIDNVEYQNTQTIPDGSVTLSQLSPEVLDLFTIKRVDMGTGTVINWTAPNGTFTHNTLTGNITFTDSNLPQDTDTKPITLYINPSTFSITVPAYWVFMGGTATPSVINEFTIECVNGNIGSELVYYWINPQSA